MSSVETPPSRTSARITKAEEYDLVMLGSGFGSKFLAWTFAEEGHRVATIERKYLGGHGPERSRRCIGLSILHAAAHVRIKREILDLQQHPARSRRRHLGLFEAKVPWLNGALGPGGENNSLYPCVSHTWCVAAPPHSC